MLAFLHSKFRSELTTYHSISEEPGLDMCGSMILIFCVIFQPSQRRDVKPVAVYVPVSERC